MAHLLTSYNALSASSPRVDVSKVLNAIMSGLWLIHPPSSRPPRSDVCASTLHGQRKSRGSRLCPSIRHQVMQARQHEWQASSHWYLPQLVPRPLSRPNSLSQMPISLFQRSRLWVVIRPGRP